MSESLRIRRSSPVAKELHNLITSQGSCRDHKKLFYLTIDNTQEGKMAAEKAINICETICPVQRPCLEYAVITREKCGVWGGVLFDSSRNLRKRIAVVSERLDLKERANKEGKHS